MSDDIGFEAIILEEAEFYKNSGAGGLRLRAGLTGQQPGGGQGQDEADQMPQAQGLLEKEGA